MKNSKNKVIPITSQGETEDNLVATFESVLQDLGEDPRREGLKRTPIRVAKALRFLTQGYHQNIDDIVNGALFTEDNDEMVTMRDIEIYSLCEHHLLPFFGKCHVAYIPNKRI